MIDMQKRNQKVSGARACVPFHGAAVDVVRCRWANQLKRENPARIDDDMPEINRVASAVQTGIPATSPYELLARRPDP